MTKAILLSIKPQHAFNIITGNKTLELRKRVPKGFKGWVYVYVTKGKPRLSVVHDDENGKTYRYINSTWGRELNGDVVARFWFDEYEFFIGPNDSHILSYLDNGNPFCLTHKEIVDYGKGKNLYAWHIKNLDIFDKPMELREFYKDLEWFDMGTNPLTKAPQSYQYVWVEEK